MTESSATWAGRSRRRRGGRMRFAGEWLSTADASRWPAPPAGGGRPVLLIPGFLVDDRSLSRMAAWLRSGGFRTYRSGIVLNTGCTESLVTNLESRLASVAERAGRPAVVLGQSRGGTLGRVLAVRRPELVEQLVTLGSPTRDLMAVHRVAWVGIGAVGLLGTLGVPGCFSITCRAGDCCADARSDLTGPFPAGVRYISVYSRSDEIVKWEACLDPAAEAIEVDTTHIGMGMDAAVWRTLAPVI